MKCFVYMKENNSNVAVLKDVVTVIHQGKNIIFTTKSGEVFSFDTKIFKTTSYQY